MGLYKCKRGREMTFVDGTMNASLCTQILDEKSLKRLGRGGISNMTVIPKTKLWV